MGSIVDSQGNPLPSGSNKGSGKEKQVNFDVVVDQKDLDNLEKKGFVDSFKSYLNKLPQVVYGLSNYFDIKKFYIHLNDESSDLVTEKESVIRVIPSNFENYKEEEKSQDEGNKEDDSDSDETNEESKDSEE